MTNLSQKQAARRHAVFESLASVNDIFVKKDAIEYLENTALLAQAQAAVDAIQKNIEALRKVI
jgi:hypothetical protein